MLYRERIRICLFWLALGVAFSMGAQRYFLLFHGVAEILSIGIGFAVFFLAFNTAFTRSNAFITVLGVGLLFVSLLDMLHTLTYKGMGVFPDAGANLTTQLWLAGRFLQVGAFAAATLLIRKPVRRQMVISAYALATALLLVLVAGGLFPEAYAEGVGLTRFKVACEYAVCVAFLVIAFLLYRRRQRFDPHVFAFLQGAIACLVVAELAFTLYVSVYGISNIVGHYFKCLAYYLIYKGVVETTLCSPVRTVFRQFQEENQRQGEELRLRTEELGLVFENVQVGLMFLHGNRVIYHCNKRMAEILGYASSDEMVGVAMKKLHLTEDAYSQFGLEHYDHLRDGPVKGECQLRRKDGTAVWCRCSGIALDIARPADLGKGILWTVDDITEIKDKEEELQQKAIWMHSMFNSLDEAVLLVTPDRKLIEVNASTERIFGYTFRELCYLSTEVLHVDREHYEEFGRRIASAFGQGKSAEFEFEARRRSGEVFPTEHLVAQLSNLDGSPLGIVSVVRDISERKKAQAALQESEAKFRKLFHVAGFPLCYANNEGVILDLNLKFTEVFGYTQEDVPTLDQWWLLAYPDPEYRAWVVETWGEAVRRSVEEGRDIESIEYSVTCKNGDVRQVLIAGTTFDDHFMATFIDVTSARRYEKELAGKALQLEQANAELNQYAFVVSHDLKAPLRAIHNYASFIREDMQDFALPEEVSQYLGGLARAVEQCEDFVDDLLEFSRVGRNRDEVKLNLRKLALDVVDTMALPADTRVVMADEPIEFYSCPLLLKQILSNLISNAAKFNESPEKLVTISWSEQPGGLLKLCVGDNGIGIEPRYQAQIFQVFQRLHTWSEYEGTGIGLAIVKKAAESLGGTASVQSVAGEGSTFCVSLPLKTSSRHANSREERT